MSFFSFEQGDDEVAVPAIQSSSASSDDSVRGDDSSVVSDSPGTSDEGTHQESFDEIVAKEFGTGPGLASYTIARDLHERTHELDKLKSEVDPIRKRIKDINQEMFDVREKYNAILRALNDEKFALEEKRKIYEFDIKRMEREVTELKRLLELELAKERASAQFRSNLLHFDDITAGLYWREFAKDYQLDGARLMANNHRTILADKMGLGKTLTSIIATDMLEAQRILVIAPSDVCNNFAEEFQEWAPHRMVLNVYKMPASVRKATLGVAKSVTSFVVIMNYEAWRVDDELIDTLIDLRFDTMILDEAHTIKNTRTDAFKGVKRIALAENSCPRCGAPDEQRESPGRMNTYYYGCIRCEWDSRTDRDYNMVQRFSVRNIFPMTGTPILNKPQELYPLLHLLMPDIFSTEKVFLDLYCQQDPYKGYWMFRSGALAKLSFHLSGKYIARTKEMVNVDIPDAKPIIHDIPFDTEKYPNQWDIIQQLSKHAQIILESGKKMSVFHTIELILRKRQANVWPGGIQIKDADGMIVFSVGEEVVESLKVDWAVEKIVDTEGERAVVFSQFKGPLRELQSRLTKVGISSVVMDGSTPQALRDEIRHDFNRKYCDEPGYEKKWQVVLCNYKTGGVGLNLTGATLMIVLDEEWNPGKNEQAHARIARIGQTGNPSIHVLRIDRTIDTWMAALNEFKANVVGGMDQTGQELTSNLLDAMKNGEIV